MRSSVLFIVWVWQQPDRRGRERFQASVRAVDAEDALVFTRAVDVTRFLVQVSRGLRGDPGAPNPGEPS
jgi:hypothetical protein